MPISMPVSLTLPSLINVLGRTIRRGNPLSCVGWIADPSFGSDSYLIPLAVSDPDGEIINTDKSMQFQIIKENRDYRLSFMNSKSKLINQVTKVNLSDTKWHFLAFLCAEEGLMSYMVDGIALPAEAGSGTEGMPFNRAWTYEPRLGGGNVWSPYLYGPGQAVSVYYWRMISGFTLSEITVKTLYERDRRSLELS